MGSIRWQFRPRYRHEYFWRFGSIEGAAKKVWIRAEPGRHRREGAAKEKVIQELCPKTFKV
jgi:hypothetical protein